MQELHCVWLPTLMHWLAIVDIRGDSIQIQPIFTIFVNWRAVVIGERIKQARESQGWNQRILADATGITAMAISKYERALSTPSSGVLLRLAKALGLRVEYFLRGAPVTLNHIEYRKHKNLPEQHRNKVIADVKDQIERRLALNEFLPEVWSTPFNRPKLAGSINALDEIEAMADKLRKHWQLGVNPIPDLIDTLEEHGLKVFTTVHGNIARFDGLSAQASGMPLVVVGAGDDWVGDRQRFTLAHELGHLLLEGRMPKTWDEQQREQACNRFAGALLVPQAEVIKALGHKRSWLEPQELLQLKHEFGLSMGGWIHRAHELGIITDKTNKALWQLFRERGWKHREPGEQVAEETVRRFTQLVYRALAEELIGESKAAELLGLSLYELRSQRNFENRTQECPENAAD